ncbi:uncharacterized protein LOC111231542 isoform X2 [Seriola dumerili]|uniref:uncharacterized protein LOC111231542 isoform X2 n=1 Tax=Seriola dumerili TaxID=41447 RepID=UPI000BBEBFB0|nr:uncharacterized protein LOC111231542 isoform X2 [Seriola dumerili]
MMGFLYVAVAVLSLLSVGQSAPVTDCESLVRPLEIQGRDKLLGKWMYIAESTNVTGSKLLTKMAVESSWGRITAANESDAIDHYQAQKMFGQCFTLRTKLTLRNSTLSMGRRGKLSDAELQEFMKQVECLNLPSPAILDPEKGFCPDEFPSQETETIDLTDFMNDMGSEIVNLFDKIMSSGDGLETLIKLISSSDISDFKKN